MERTINISGVQFRANAITIGELRKLQPVLDGLGKSDPFQSILDLMPLVHASLRKAHPDLKQENLENMITVENFSEVFNAVLEASGLRKSVGEVPPATA
jgi:hypothetical protein